MTDEWSLASFLNPFMDTQNKKLPKDLLDFLVCPDDRADLIYDEEKNILVCTKCQKEFAIENGIPVMMPSENNNNY